MHPNEVNNKRTTHVRNALYPTWHCRENIIYPVNSNTVNGTINNKITQKLFQLKQFSHKNVFPQYRYKVTNK